MKETFWLDDKRSVVITVNEFDCAVVVRDADDSKLVDELEFRLIEGQNPGFPDELKLTSAFLDKSSSDYKRQGIGRRCLQWCERPVNWKSSPLNWMANVKTMAVT